MDQENEEYMKIQTSVRKDVAEALGSDMEKTFTALQNHIMDAVSYTLTIHQRYQCINCIQERVYFAFFQWLNSEGHVHVVRDDYSYSELCAHTARWAMKWVEEQMLSPCTDGFPSLEVH